ncbi:hypothetical protein J3F84DRAFT_373915 [Trichoderma pleuroticola]
MLSPVMPTERLHVIRTLFSELYYAYLYCVNHYQHAKWELIDKFQLSTLSTPCDQLQRKVPQASLMLTECLDDARCPISLGLLPQRMLILLNIHTCTLPCNLFSEGEQSTPCFSRLATSLAALLSKIFYKIRCMSGNSIHEDSVVSIAYFQMIQNHGYLVQFGPCSLRLFSRVYGPGTSTESPAKGHLAYSSGTHSAAVSHESRCVTASLFESSIRIERVDTGRCAR